MLCYGSLSRCRYLVVCLFSSSLLLYFYFNFMHLKSLSVGSGDFVHSRLYSARPSRALCVEKRNFVFIKQMKCATSTLLKTFYRFGYTRNLSFVSPMERNIYLNWPYPMITEDFRPSSSGYNILVDHAIYTPDVMESVMPDDTLYLSIIRHPFSHAKSVFEYFNLGSVAGLPHTGEHPFLEYFSHIQQYDARYKQAKDTLRFCVPGNFSMTKNIMSHCLGMPLGFPPGSPDISASLATIDDYIKYIEQKFSLVMIVEYFFESLVLLRRLMCWSFNDVVFMKANVGKYSFDTNEIPQFVRHIHQQWSYIDYRLYEHFNKTLWIKIAEQGSDLFHEVAALKKVESKVRKYCHNLYHLGERPAYRYPYGLQQLSFPGNPWSDAFSITPQDCWMLGPKTYRLPRAVQRENDVKEAALLKARSKVKDRRKLKGLC